MDSALEMFRLQEERFQKMLKLLGLPMGSDIMRQAGSAHESLMSATSIAEDNLRREYERLEELARAMHPPHLELLEQASTLRAMAEGVDPGMSTAHDLWEKMRDMERGPFSGIRFDMPEIRMPRREDDCPAAPVCEAVGNLYKACRKGSQFPSGPGLDACTASLILLVARATGMWPQEMIEEVEEKRRRIGFGTPDDAPPEEPGDSE